MILLFLLSGLALSTANNSSDKTEQFVQRWYRVAQIEQEDHSIPASITLAQAIIESGSGKSTLARKANNLFGIKCWKCTSNYLEMEDDNPDDKFKKYPNQWKSFQDHSKVLLKKRYKPCFKSINLDEWCDCLKGAGYATNPNYSRILKRVIENYDLEKYDLKGD